MKKVFQILCVIQFPDKSWRIFDTIKASSREDAETMIKEEKEFDKKYIHTTSFNYFIFEGLVITKEKINEIITNSNVQ